MAINPATRAMPRDFIETGISTIDLMNSLVRGQKLPIFSGAGLPHDRLAIQITQQARLRDARAGEFAVVFVAIGVSYDSAEQFRSAMEDSGALEHTVLFLNLASDSSTQRLLSPRYALTAAEYLAFELGKHVLVVMTDMTNYCEALREVSASHGEVPSRKGFPGYLYSDLATLYERAGALEGIPGSLTQLPILTMPSDDITHPIPDLTGYITEGQIVLERGLDRADIAEHPDLANQLYAAYARAVHVRVLASVVGRDGLAPIDQQFLDFGERFEKQLVHQAASRTLEQSMEIGWDLLRQLPSSELHRLSDAQIARHIKVEAEA
jgi:V/A-type H+-transporting ATPase subunit B